MSKADDTLFQIVGSAGKLPVLPHDSLARQLGMLFECRCMGLSVDEVAKKYSYSRQRYFQIQHAFLSGGTEALLPQKRGPRFKHIRQESVVTQIIRHKFLDPQASADVITQKLKQCNIKISKRSVQRTLAEYGLQKKTLRLKFGSEAKIYD